MILQTFINANFNWRMQYIENSDRKIKLLKISCNLDIITNSSTKMKTFFLIFAFVFSILVSSAQYRKYKNSYVAKSYSYQSEDRYKPLTAGVLAIIPGAGHIYAGEPIRGLIFPVGMAVSAYLISCGSLTEWAAQGSPNSGSSLTAVGLISFVGFYTFNFFDAVKVTKIKNMHLRQKALSFQFEPCFESQLNSNVAGLSLKFTF